MLPFQLSVRFLFISCISPPDDLMDEVYVRTTNTFGYDNGGWDDINGGSYGGTVPFNATLGDLCGIMTNFTDSEIWEMYCSKILIRRFVVLHTTGQRLQFCEIQVYNHGGN